MLYVFAIDCMSLVYAIYVSLMLYGFGVCYMCLLYSLCVLCCMCLVYAHIFGGTLTYIQWQEEYIRCPAL